ncbi:hypothetical protein [Streptomyces abyssomicinicus]|uniref:hypothetical protein n=1 Tax=Streptomyces abyssomicinicus TaxID=574929 RepID=UPI0012508F2A|nr:hypothetical protein [Streptomyces abyssomicinicus]
MKYDLLQVAGMILLAVAGQGLVRLLLDHQDLGLLRNLPGGFAATLTVHAVVTVAGALLAGWSHGRAKALGRRR